MRKFAHRKINFIMHLSLGRHQLQIPLYKVTIVIKRIRTNIRPQLLRSSFQDNNQENNSSNRRKFQRFGQASISVNFMLNRQTYTSSLPYHESLWGEGERYRASFSPQATQQLLLKGKQTSLKRSNEKSTLRNLHFSRKCRLTYCLAPSLFSQKYIGKREKRNSNVSSLALS